MRFDGGLVHVGVVEVADLALVGAGGCVGFGGVLDDAGDLLEAEVGEVAEDVDGGAVCGEFRAGDEAAVGVEVEVVAGVDGGSMLGMEMPVSGVWAEAEMVTAQRRRGRMRRVRLVIRLDTPLGASGRRR